MSRGRWHILRDDTVLTLARRVPVRFDLSASTRLPDGSRLQLAQQVRQDIWRALQGLKGFTPVVRVERVASGLKVTAGGQVAGVFPRLQAEARIAEVLEDPKNRARWVRWAQ
ncbi:hypothetical protein [Roseovarius aestuarii]|uniref:Uncharacterized protein n=1 Tax=Roseovarius aestuarii TaxID=475083 RepID=A0A1X7BSH5_9RHOB|nr:hypothetical protein [Roseovarius aestuarii]SMC12558.1 hypothetical protein ROA7745_02386 [Roseovarius aestuarii]